MVHRTPLRNLFPPVPSFPLSDGTAALLVLDLQPFTADRAQGWGAMAAERGIATELDEYFEQVEYVLPNVRELLDGFRSRGLPVIFTRLASLATGKDRGQPAYLGWLLSPDDLAAQVLPSLDPRPAEIVLTKNTLSPFASAPLDVILRALGVKTVVLVGVMAGWGIDLAAREASDRGYQVLVVSDACAGESFEIHAFSMPQLVGGLIRVRPTGSVLQMLAGTRT